MRRALGKLGLCLSSTAVCLCAAELLARALLSTPERIHVAWCDGGEFKPRHLEYLEAEAFRGAKWWTLDELMASEEPVLPTRLREFLPPIVRGELPDEPIDISPYPLD